MHDRRCTDQPKPDCITAFDRIDGALQTITAQLDKHADVIDSIIEERQVRKAFWESVRTHLVSNGLWGIIAVIAYVLWYATQTYITTKH